MGHRSNKLRVLLYSIHRLVLKALVPDVQHASGQRYVDPKSVSQIFENLRNPTRCIEKTRWIIICGPRSWNYWDHHNILLVYRQKLTEMLRFFEYQNPVRYPFLKLCIVIFSVGKSVRERW